MPRRPRARKREPIKWITVYAPSAFGKTEVGEIATRKLDSVIGRTVETTLFDITGTIEHQFIKLYFKIMDLNDSEAHTVFKMHEFTRDYIRSIVRRGTSRVDAIIDAVTKDGWYIRIRVLAVTKKRVTSSIKSAIRKVAFKVVEKEVPELTLDELAREMTLGKLASDIYNEAKKVYPLKVVIIAKSKVLRRVWIPEEKEEVAETVVKEAVSGGG